MKLFCIRHGETVYNLEGRIQGQADSHLSPLGFKQCEAMADALAAEWRKSDPDFCIPGGESRRDVMIRAGAGEPIELIISSPLARAIESARVAIDRQRKPVSSGHHLRRQWP